MLVENNVKMTTPESAKDKKLKKTQKPATDIIVFLWGPS